MSEENINAIENNINTTPSEDVTNNIENLKTKEDAEKLLENIDLKKYLYSFYAKANGENKKFFILRPNRKLKQAGELEYAKQLAKFVKAGLLPKAAWGTILDNAGGTISDSDAENYSNSKNKFFELSLELGRLQQQDKTDENETKIQEVMFDIEAVKNQIQSFELEQIYVFENTAEAKARNATIEWWLCNLAVEENDELFFKGKDIEDRLDWYDSLNSGDKTEQELLKIGQRFSYLITLWFLNRVSSQEEFKEADIGRK